MKTKEEVAQLKSEWLTLSSSVEGGFLRSKWPLEYSEGYEDYFNELRAYRSFVEDEALAFERARQKARMEMLGIPGNVALLVWIEGMERALESLKSALVERAAI